jgi:hypothetical protein
MYEDILRCKTNLYQYTLLSNALFFSLFRFKSSQIILFLYSIYYLIGNYEIFQNKINHEVILRNHFKFKKETFKSSISLFKNRIKWIYICFLPCLIFQLSYYSVPYFSKIIMQEISISLVNSITIKLPKEFKFPNQYGLCSYHSKNPYNIDYGLLFFGISTEHKPFILERVNLFTKIKTYTNMYYSIPVIVKDKKGSKEEQEKIKQENKKILDIAKQEFKRYSHSTFVFFPEGTNNKEGLGTFYEGGFTFCKDLNIPIIPMIIMMTETYDVYIEILDIQKSNSSKDLIYSKMNKLYKEYKKKYNIIN